MNRSTAQQEFGGLWTDHKLKLLKDYLESYMVIFRKYTYLTPVYIDAFAGTGQRPGNAKGSPRVALEISAPAFQKYIFVEKSTKKCQELETLKGDYPEQSERIEVVNEDATIFLSEWCSKMTSNTRAVVFLDPFGMQVEWSLLETIASTQKIDLWLLVPIGMGVNRLLTKDEFPPEDWSQKLTRFLGTDEWQDRFYRPKKQPSLFDEDTRVEKSANYDALCDYFIERLETIFPGVAKNPLTQRNSNKSPMFLLCFMTANPNPKTKQAALNIAQYLLKEG